MGWGFRKSIKIAPGVRINLSKKGVSASLGTKGFTYNTRGRVTASIPGTGIRYTQNLNSRRSSGRLDPRLTGATSIDSNSAARLSNREQATKDFAELLQNRLIDTLRRYFLSHGIYVAHEDIAEAATLDDHQEFLNGIAGDLEVTSRAIRLAVDIGTISLAEKEKAMRALYDVEKQCSEHAGDHEGLDAAANTLSTAIAQWPARPALLWPFIICVVGWLIMSSGNLSLGGAIVAGTLLYGFFKIRTFSRQKSQSKAEIDEANRQFSLRVLTEVTPRPAFVAPADPTRAKAWILGFIVALLVSSALVRSHEEGKTEVASSVESPAKAQNISAENTTNKRTNSNQNAKNNENSKGIPGYGWLQGKHPADVINDARFKAAFYGVSASDWKKIAERLYVSDKDGIQRKNGHYFSEGCKAHFCGSDIAAFSIDETTGKGTIVYKETTDYAANKAIAKGFGWPDASLEGSPIVAWLASNGMSVSKDQPKAAEAPPVQKTSFDCNKARSYAEKLICQDPELAQYDRELADEFAKAKLAANDQTALKTHARQAWNYRETACRDRECLIRWYVDEKIALKEFQ